MGARARSELSGWWHVGLAVVGAVLRCCFRAQFVGVERVPARGPAVLACNHVSALDGPFLALAAGCKRKRMTRFLVASEFFERPQFGWALRLLQQIPLRRGTRDMGALEEAGRTIRAGALAGIFPEGRVNPEPEGGLQRGRRGMATIALKSRAPVVPVGIWGTQDRWPRDGLHFRRPWRPRVALVFGEPMEPSGDIASRADLKAFTESVMTSIGTQVSRARSITQGR
ncbi:MAG: lysophospholipid acyltransferase family protein [Actinomycetota bacterium]